MLLIQISTLNPGVYNLMKDYKPQIAQITRTNGQRKLIVNMYFSENYLPLVTDRWFVQFVVGKNY